MAFCLHYNAHYVPAVGCAISTSCLWRTACANICTDKHLPSGQRLNRSSPWAKVNSANNIRRTRVGARGHGKNKKKTRPPHTHTHIHTAHHSSPVLSNDESKLGQICIASIETPFWVGFLWHERPAYANYMCTMEHSLWCNPTQTHIMNCMQRHRHRWLLAWLCSAFTAARMPYAVASTYGTYINTLPAYSKKNYAGGAFVSIRAVWSVHIRWHGKQDQIEVAAPALLCIFCVSDNSILESN